MTFSKEHPDCLGAISKKQLAFSKEVVSLFQKAFAKESCSLGLPTDFNFLTGSLLVPQTLQQAGGNLRTAVCCPGEISFNHDFKPFKKKNQFAYA